MDLIDRQAAIDFVDAGRLVNPNEPRWSDNEVVAFLKSRPSAQPEQRWIPVTERLPEDEYVLISKKPTKILGYKWSVDIAIRTADPRSGKIQWRDIGFGVIQDDKVLAWMPRPKPYREEGDEPRWSDNEVVAFLQSRPSAQHEKGTWIEVGREEGALGIVYKRFRCSKCGWESSLLIPRKFCPECGADMRKSDISIAVERKGGTNEYL